MQGANGENDGKNVEMVRVPVDQVSSEKDGRPAEAVFPVRVAIINAAYPYRRQYEGFKSAMEMPSIEAMEAEATVEFLGVNVQRREIGPDGKPSGDSRELDLIRRSAPSSPSASSPRTQC